MMTSVEIEDAANRLLAARRDRSPITAFTEASGLDRDTAYEIQQAGVALRSAMGHRIVGAKVGMTNAGRAAMLGIAPSGPVVGQLYDVGEITDGQLDIGTLIQPRVEPEIVFCLNRPLRGPGITVRDVIQATEWVAPGFEIVDSSFAGFKFQIEDSIADGCSGAAFMVGDTVHRLADVGDLSLLGCVLDVDGVVVASGTGAGVLGHPARAVAFAANELVARGRPSLEAGSIVFTGAFSDAAPISGAHSVTARFAGLGSIHLAIDSAAESAA